MSTHRQKLAVVATAVSVALLAGCGMMRNNMHGGESVLLAAQNEVPPASSTAAGSGMVTVGSDCMVSVRVTVTGMMATAAHIHEGAPGANGPVIVPLNKAGDNSFEAASGAKMTEGQCAAYRAGNTYVNVHSDKFKGGEVRGQLKGR